MSGAEPSNPRGWRALLERHWEALRYVVAVVLPALARNRARPVIFSRQSGIGDILCTFPAALELKKRHPGAEFIYNCHEGSGVLPRLGGVASQVTSIRHIGLVGHWYRWLLAGFYHFGYQDEDPHAASAESMIKEFGRQHGVRVGEDHPRLHHDPAVLERMKALLAELALCAGPLILLHSGPSWPVREWSLESWAELVQELRHRGFTNIVRLGVGRHLTFGEVEVAEIPGTIPLVDRLSLEECVAMISLGDLFIGIDSGLLHIAPCVDTPAVGIWGPTLPHLRFSSGEARSFVTGHVECLGCHHRVPRLHWITNCPFEIACMKSIGVEEVLQRSLSRLEPIAQVRR